MKKSVNWTDELLVKYLTGMADSNEREDALTWIRQSKENRHYFNTLRDVYEASKLAQPEAKYNTDFAWEKVKARHYKTLIEKFQFEREKDRKLFILGIFKYVALVLFIIALSIIGYLLAINNIKKAKPEIWQTIEAPFGTRSRLTLADGTHVWLNAGSQLRYSSFYGQYNRTVYLEGEAFFSVTEDKKKQFIVKTTHLDIKVFGTEFNVRAYPDEKIIQTTLVKGAIALEGDIIINNVKNKIILKPNQTATYFIGVKGDKTNENISNKVIRNENLEIKPSVNPLVYTSWKDDKWIFEGETLSNLAIKLERRFNVKFIFESETMQNYKFTGTLKDETLEQMLNVIKLSAPIQYSIKDNVVYLKENKTFKNLYDDLLIKK